MFMPFTYVIWCVIGFIFLFFRSGWSWRRSIQNVVTIGQIVWISIDKEQTDKLLLLGLYRYVYVRIRYSILFNITNNETSFSIYTPNDIHGSLLIYSHSDWKLPIILYLIIIYLYSSGERITYAECAQSR